MESSGIPVRAETGRCKTIEQFIIDQQGRFPHSTGAFSRLLRDISVAAKVVNRDIRRAGLLDDVLGVTGEINVQGEVQQKLDAIAHHEFVEALRLGRECCLIGSEEHDEVILLPSAHPESEGRYVVLFDPLDGSSNIEVAAPVGTIFSIYRLEDGCAGVEPDVVLRPGAHQVAAGYVVYGASTMLVYTTGDGVNGFTLDPTIGEFLLSHPMMRIPPAGGFYSIDEGNTGAYSPGLLRFLASLKEPDAAGGRPLKTRYIGSFVADFHRNLLLGGIFVYPASRTYPEGKLRLMYEANPMAFLAEQAGGRASDGRRRVLDLAPTSLHQRTPLFIGSADLVRRAEHFLVEADVEEPSEAR